MKKIAATMAWFALLIWMATRFLLMLAEASTTPPRLVFARVSTNETTNETNVTLLDNGGYLAVSSDAWSVVVPRNCGVATTSAQAKQYQCTVATNGGPFESYFHGGCTGGVVSNGRVISSIFSPQSVGFGLGQNKDNSQEQWVLGGVANETEAVEQLGLTQFVTGFGWLVYNGTAVVNSDNSNNPAGAKKSAPRTAVGIDHEGRIMLLVVDGCEKCFRPKGLTLYQLAQLLIALGAQHAINLDGGGSTTFVQNGRVVNVPTCLDVVPLKCERPVTTVMCLGGQSANEVYKIT